MKKFYITTAIDYVNASPHIGHAMEKILADCISRFRRLQGEEVLFLSGTDENSLKNVRAAEKEKIPVAELVDKYSRKFRELEEALNLSFGDFIRTTEKRHVSGSQKLWLACQKDIYRKSYQGLYCVDCEKFYKENELSDGLCPDHKTRPELVSEDNYFFRLSKYQKKLKKIIRKGRIRIIPEARKNEVLSFIEQGLEDICVSRSSERAQGWGIDVPDDPSQKIWVWFDALSNYVNALGYGENSDKFRNWWQKNKNKVHVIGKDILRFHAVYWPAMLLSAGLKLPNAILAHGFVTVNGQKMSKSLGNVIDPFELAEKYGPDAVRYFFLAEFPAFDDGDFTFGKFEARYNADLANGIGNLFERVLTMMKNHGFEPKFEKPEIDPEISSFAKKSQKDYSQKMGDFRTYEATGTVLSFSRKLDQYINQKEPWKLIGKKDAGMDEIMNTLIFGIKKIVVWLKPFIPGKMEQTENYLENFASQKEKLNLFPRI